MKQFYQDGQEVLLGDWIKYNGQEGKVVAIGSSQQYTLRFPKPDWEESLGEGFLIEFTNCALLRLDKADSDEYLLLVRREK